MKITATPIAPVSVSRPYPKLMVSGDGQRIVFFLSETCGFLLVPSGRHQHYYSEFWIVNEFHDYSGTITIQDGD